MKRILVISGLCLSVCYHGFSYVENFEPAPGSLAAVGWSFWAYHQGVGASSPQVTDLSAATAAIGVASRTSNPTNPTYGFFTPAQAPDVGGDLQNSPGLLFTSEIAPLDVEDIESVSFEWSGDNTNASIRIAIEVDGVWYVSDTSYIDSRSNPGADAAFLDQVYQPDPFVQSSNWRMLNNATLGSATPIGIGAVAGADLSGPVSRIGFLLDAGTAPAAAGDHVRVDSVEVIATATPPPPPPARPNVLFISIDDLADVPNFMGRNPDCLTPNMDSLAASGTVFLQAHCNYPLCGPSRASALSGLRPSTLGFQDHMTPSQAETRARSLGGAPLQSWFKQNGYKTMSCGKIYHAGHPATDIDMTGGSADDGAKEGINYSHPDTRTDWGVPSYGGSDSNFADYKNAQWAVARLNETHTKPFLLMVGFIQPHVPWYTPQSYFNLYPDPNALTLPTFPANDLDDISTFAQNISITYEYPRTTWMMSTDTENDGTKEWAEAVRAYYACVSFTDTYLGQVLTALKNSPYADNTVIVLWSDHGYQLGEKNTFQKLTLWERSTHVPVIIAGPGLPAGQRCSRLVSLIDLYPTLVDLCGLPENAVLEGRSLVPLIEDPNRAWEDRPSVISMQGNNHAVQTEDFKFILYADGSEELYDLQTDRDEHHNLAANPAYASTIGMLKKELPTSLTSPQFQLRFDIANPQTYLNGLLADGELRIYGQSVPDLNTYVEGMRLSSSISGSTLTLNLVPGASPFGIWRAAHFTGRELRDLEISGSAGNGDNDSLGNLGDYALGFDPRQPDAAIDFSMIPAGEAQQPELGFNRFASRNDADILVQSSPDLSPENWQTIAQSTGGAAMTGSGGSEVSEEGSEPVAVKVRAPEDTGETPKSFFRLIFQLTE